MKKIKLTEKDLTNIINKVINEKLVDVESTDKRIELVRNYMKEMGITTQKDADLIRNMDAPEYYLLLKLSKSFKNIFGKMSYEEFKAVLEGYYREFTDDSVVVEQEEEEGIEEEDIMKLNTNTSRITELEKRLDLLEDDYMRKIGFGDHHQHPPPL